MVKRAAAINIMGSPSMGREWGQILPPSIRMKKIMKGRETRIQFIFRGTSGSSSRALFRSMGFVRQPRIKIVNRDSSKQGRSSGRKKPTYGMLTPAAVSIAHRLTGGAAALKPAMMKIMAAVLGREIPMYPRTMPIIPPVIKTVTLPAPVRAPGISKRRDISIKRIVFLR